MPPAVDRSQEQDDAARAHTLTLRRPKHRVSCVILGGGASSSARPSANVAYVIASSSAARFGSASSRSAHGPGRGRLSAPYKCALIDAPPEAVNKRISSGSVSPRSQPRPHSGHPPRYSTAQAYTPFVLQTTSHTLLLHLTPVLWENEPHNNYIHMGQCCSASHIQDDEVELSARNGPTSSTSNHQPHPHPHPTSNATNQAALPRVSLSASPTNDSMPTSTAAATEESGPFAPRPESAARPPSSAQAHISDWDWERGSSPSDPSDTSGAQAPRARVESTSTTRELRYVLQRTLGGGAPVSGSRPPTVQHRGRAENAQPGARRPPREHAPGRFGGRMAGQGKEESTVPWPSAREGQ